MTNEQKLVRDWMKKYGQETPDKPIVPSLEVRKLRAKLILEEALETIEALGLLPYIADHYVSHRVRNTLHFKENDCKDKLTLKDIADGCEDLKVVTEGTLVACGLIKENTWTTRKLVEGKEECEFKEFEPNHYNKDPLFTEVMRANEDKFWTAEETETPEWLAKINNDNYDAILVNNNERCYLVKDANGKVVKPPNWKPPQLEAIIEEMKR